ncbi:hypothetical protein L208DRAFT_1157098, partial [Tricholoma matsutake]
KIVSHPPLLAFEWGINTPVLNNTLDIMVDATAHTYHLSGVIYLHCEHFTCHFIDHEGQPWFHDGIITGTT